MGVRGLQTAFRPERVAIVGATDRAGSVGRAVVENVLTGFNGSVDLINASGRALFGRPSLRSIDDLVAPPDLAVVAVPPESLTACLTALRAKRANAALIITDPRRLGRPVDKADLLAAAGPVRLIGPGSFGLSAPGCGLHASLSKLRPAPGGIAFVGQSATAAGPLVDWACGRGFGFSHVLSLGDLADVDLADALDALADEASARVVVLFIEAVASPRRLLSAARALARIKPVVAMKSAEIAATPARDAVFDAAFLRAGLLRARSLDELFDAIEALSSRLPADARPTQLGDRLAIIANGASLAALAVDSVRAAEVRLAAPSSASRLAAGAASPANHDDDPIDLGPDAPPERFEAAVTAVLEDPDVDAALVVNGPTGVCPGDEAAAAVVRALQARRAKPSGRRAWVFASWPGGEHAKAAEAIFDAAHVPHFATPSQAVRAYGQLVRHRRALDALMRTPSSSPDAFAFDVEAGARAIAGATNLDADRLPADRARALACAYGFEFEAGGADRAGDIVIRVRAALDPDFGPVLTAKLADPVGRKLDPGAAALAPLDLALAEMALRSGLVGRLLAGAEGALDAAAVTLVRAAQILVDHPEVTGLLLDPVRIRDGRAVLSAIEVRAAPWRGRDPADRFAVRPYPKDWEADLVDRTGERYRLRPIRPEDEPALIRLIGRMDPEDLRLRFFQPIAHVTHAFAARLSQIDYDRERALVLAEPNKRPGEAEIFGVVRLVCDPDGETGEYAVTVDSSRHGRGLGRRLMEALLDHAGRARLSEVFGLVMRENAPMLTLARSLGFTAALESDDPTIIRVRRRLESDPTRRSVATASIGD